MSECIDLNKFNTSLPITSLSENSRDKSLVEKSSLHESIEPTISGVDSLGLKSADDESLKAVKDSIETSKNHDITTEEKIELIKSKEKMISQLYPDAVIDIRKRSESINLSILAIEFENYNGKKGTIAANKLDEQEEQLKKLNNSKLVLLNMMIKKLITDMLVWEILIKDNNSNIDDNTDNSQIVKQLKLITTTMFYYCYNIWNLIDKIKRALKCTKLSSADGPYIDDLIDGNFKNNSNLCENLRRLTRAVYDVILSIQNYGFDNYDKNYDLIQINIAGLVNSLMLELYLFNEKNIPPPKKGGTIKKTKRNKKTKKQKRKRNNTKRKYNIKYGKFSSRKKSKFRRYSIRNKK